VTNSGTRIGSEVVQLYVGHPGATVARPPLELRAFRKLHLAPGASEVVSFNLGSRAFAYWSTSESNWVVAPGRYEVLVGSSSRDIHLSAVVELPGAPDGRKKLDDLATLEEWLADPRGHEALIRAVGTGADGTPNGILGDPGRISVIGNFPLRTLAVFPNVGLNHDIVDALCVELAGS
jgi:beta-glucosidase